MKKSILLLFLVFSFLYGCSTTTPVAITGELYMGKKGEDCQYGLLFFPPFVGSSTSIEEAKRDGGIARVSSVDRIHSMYFLFNKNCTIAYGN